MSPIFAQNRTAGLRRIHAKGVPALVAAQPRLHGGSPEFIRGGGASFRAFCVPMVYIGKRWAPKSLERAARNTFVNRCPRWNDYSEKGAFATKSAKFGGANPSTYRVPKSRRILSKLVAGLRRTMLQRDDWSWFLSAKRGNSARIARCLSSGIRSRPNPIASTAIPEWVIATSGSL